MNTSAIISSREATLVYSNRICCFDNDQLDFKYNFTDKKEDELKIHFVFKYSVDSKQSIEMSTEVDDEITIRLTNFNNPLGAGLKKPVQIAKLNDKSIFIMFNVYKNDESNPILDLSLYMENKNAK